MKVASFSLALLACATTVSAQYFSDGWAPGKPATQEAPPPAAIPSTRAENPSAQQQQQEGRGSSSSGSMFDLSKLLETGPVSNLFSKIGVNISHQLEAARGKVDTWDPRIPLITDTNYDELIVKEDLTPEEEEKRIWFIIITAQSTLRSGMSKGLDESFDAVYNTSLIEGDLPDVRWGRIDYLNVTYLTTKWNVWQAPYILLARDHGQTLYFYQANHIRLSADNIRAFLKEETWRETTPWKTALSPGGNYEYLMHYFALGLQKTYNIMVVLPRWALMILSGAVASLIMRLMHRNPEAETPPPEPKAEDQPTPAPTSAPVTETKGASTSTPTKSKAKSRKGGKK